MANTINDAAAQDLIRRLSAFMQKAEDIARERARRRRERDEYRLHRYSAKKQAELYKALTENYTKDVKRITYDSEKAILGEFVLRELKEYNVTHPESPVLFDYQRNEMGQLEIITNQKGVDKCFDLRIKFAVEHSGKIGEIPTDKFEEMSRNKQVTVLKNLTEEQYNYISRKRQSNKTDISYTALQNHDGTYDVAVISKDYMSYNKKGGDIFTSLVTEKLVYDKNRQEADKYEQQLEEKIFNFNQTEPMYVTSTRSSSQYLKIENSQITIMRPDGDDIVIKRPGSKSSPEEKKAFAIDVFKQLDKIPEPIIIGEKTQALIKGQGMTIEEALDNHARTGSDSDFSLGMDKNGVELYERPIVDDTRQYRINKMAAVEISNAFKNDLCKGEALLAGKVYADIYKNAIDETEVSDEIKMNLKFNFEGSFMRTLAEEADGRLPGMGLQELGDVADRVLYNSIKSIVGNADECDRLNEDVLKAIKKEMKGKDVQAPKDILTKEAVEKIKEQTVMNIEQSVNRIVNKESKYDDTVKFSQNFCKVLSNKQIDAAFIDIALETVKSVYEENKEIICITKDVSLTDALTKDKGMNSKERKTYKELNEAHDRMTEAKSYVQNDKMTNAPDMIRSKNIQCIKHDKEETEMERSR